MNYILSKNCQIKIIDRIYDFFFGYKKDGVFVEVGAYDGEYVSNTSGLADIGWKGLYIEPVKRYYLKCKQRHKNNNVEVINCAIGNKSGYVDINVGGALSTIKNEVLERFKLMGWGRVFNNEKEKVEIKKLNDVLENIPINFDILVIDVEGYEWEVLQGFDIKKWQPKMVIIELHDSNKNYDIEWEDSHKIIQYFNENKYRIVFKDLSNTIYVNDNDKSIMCNK